MGQIKVSIEALGEQPLTRIYDVEDLKNKDVKTLIKSMVEERWEGKDLTAYDSVNSELKASGGFAVRTKTGGNNRIVKYEPIRLGDQVRTYEEDTGSELPEIRFAVSGHHVVG